MAIKFNFIVFLVYILRTVHAEIVNEYEYNLLPNLIDTESYHFCRTRIIPHKYCLVELTIEFTSNATNLTRHNFEILHRDPRNFRHDQIVRGRCVPNETEQNDFNFYTEMLNKELLGDGFQVASITRITCDDFKKQMDKYDIAAICVLVCIVAFVLMGTLFDACCFYKRRDDKSLSVGAKTLVCFSLIRNSIRFYSLKESKDKLQFVQGMRFLTIALVLFGHICFLTLNAPRHTVREFEALYHRIGNGLILNGPVVIQTYFFLSGMFLGYGFYKFIFKRRFHIKYLLLAITGRYNRLTPSFFILTLINATVLYHLGSGIYWEKNIGMDRANCRQNWWYNLLYISNELKSDEMCLLPGWFLSADFQLFLFSLCLLTLIWFKKEWISVILYTSFVISLFIPGIITYVYKLDPLLINYPETLRSIFANDRTFHMTYLQPHTNASSYIFGLIIGYYLYTGAISKKLSDKLWAKVSLHIFGWLCGLVVIFGGYLYIYSDSYEYNRLEAAIFASLYKIIFVMVPAMLVYGSKIGIADIYTRLLEWKPFILCGRLSFSIYLVHWPLLRVESSLEQVPVLYTHFNVIFVSFVANLVLSILLALLLALFVEFPVSALTKLFMDSSKDSRESNSGAAVIGNNTSISKSKGVTRKTNGLPIDEKFCYVNNIIT